MKSTVFELKFPRDVPDWMKETDVKFPIPTLRAYAVEYSEFFFRGGFREHKELIEGRDYFLIDDGLIWHGFFPPFGPELDYYRLVIHYHGIKDYSLLSPHIASAGLRERLGKFYEEAEANFDNGVWLSFALMCGALYEGLLYHHFGCKDEKFSALIERAQTESIVDDATAHVMHTARELRNLVHASKAEELFVSRGQAMDMRTVMDKLVKNAAEWLNRDDRHNLSM